ncbi:alpha-1,2-Mannosidase [Operophtera brumata]|uniref:Alpha-1,2-Mannosidase n=1 Tax=Operophtera brumata TaxID=104452 RepID=A0A0L7L001_OPEBR|nr:alpha-1,2-Mannosidase [Operophtera brumata]
MKLGAGELLFDADNFIHNPGVHGTVIHTPGGECVVDLGGYIFNTEAHPIDPTMLHCCHEARRGINVSEVHRVYQILEEEDNLKFMTMLEATLQKNDTNETANKTQNQTPPNATADEDNKVLKNTEKNQVLIKTETRTGYVNIDGTERETVNNESEEKVVYSFYNGTDEGLTEPKINVLESEPTKVEVDDIIVAQPPDNYIHTPSTSRTTNAFKLLPKVIQDFLNNDWKTKPKCEPQRVLERIRKEKRYPDHPDESRYELLLTAAPSFLQRISLAGEFLNKKNLEL